VSAPFPWEPFPPDEPGPKGPDPIHATAFRAAVTAADAFRSVRLALRRDAGTLRIGNRFVADGRYREVAFVSAGRAANAMALAALATFGDRLTQGFIAGSDAVDPHLPFRGATVSVGPPGAAESEGIVRAAIEIAEGLTEQDLLLVLLSAGSLRALARPPPGLTDLEFARFLTDAQGRGATGREVDQLARVLGTGAVGGRLASAVRRADAATLVVERGDGPSPIGGGPMRPVAPSERAAARATLDRIGGTDALPGSALEALRPGADTSPLPSGAVHRPIVVAAPADALRASADAVFDKGWTSRLAFLEIRDSPRAAAEAFVARSEELVAAEGLTRASRTKGVATFAMTTLGLPEGNDEGPALAEFLTVAHDLRRRREMSVGLFRTAGVVGSDRYPAGAVVGAAAHPDGAPPHGPARSITMAGGITDVGLLAVALCAPPADPS
jgi:glycerate-2-kinase